ncbi:YceD family protein [Novosphingobium sp. 9]|uniref:YceD family protein n=1 Tax=Novosphingobium sp. 9 TaxID=2025349 RepID=UPI0021B65041|nr:DUF177 domain-containing protein [Novosphingobium sp. 9]
MTDDTSSPEFSRFFDIRQAEGQIVRIEANNDECAGLAARFDLVQVNNLVAEVSLTRVEHKVEVRGTLIADFVQACAVSAEDLDVHVAEPLEFCFVQEERTYKPDEEIELEAHELDEIPYDGSRFDLGEAVAQSLALAIDPFLTGPEADAARIAVGLGTPQDHGPFAALKNLK